MNKILATALFTLFVAPAMAGVEFEIDVVDYATAKAPSGLGSAGGAAAAGTATSDEPLTTTSNVLVEGRNIKMGAGSGASDQEEVVFRGDRREIMFISHKDRAYAVVDEASMAEIGADVQKQLSGMDAQIQEMLESVPPEQRPAVEAMIRQKMPQQMQSPQQQRSVQVARTGERANKNGYPCVKYEVLVDGRRIRELWVTDWTNIEGGEDTIDAFEDMADFMSDLMAALPDFGQGPGLDDNPFAQMREIGGFPVVTREFDDYGNLSSESTLRSAKKRTIAPDAWNPPGGYERMDMFGR